MVAISAVICTNRGGATLQLAIESLLEQTIPTEKYEIVIVDNHPDQAARRLVERIVEDNGHKKIRYIHESRTGLSYARNTGAQAAQGKWVFYMDDDACA